EPGRRDRHQARSRRGDALTMNARRHALGAARFTVCLLVGVVDALAFLVFPTFGKLLLLTTALLFAVRGAEVSGEDVGGLCCGLAAPLFFVASVNRGGPGPWLVAGLVLAAIGLVTMARAWRRDG